MSETAIVAATLLALSKLPGVRVWRNSTGVLRVGDRAVRFGLTGSADILGLLAPSGRLIAVEAKTPTGKQTPEQKSFESMVTKYGGLYLLIHSAEEAVVLITPHLANRA